MRILARSLSVGAVVIPLAACSGSPGPALGPVPQVVPVRTTATGLVGEVDARDIQEVVNGLIGASADSRGAPTALEDQVRYYVRLYSQDSSMREKFRRWLERAGRYRPLIERELDRADLPLELIYLALIESAFTPEAVSSANAVGMWQFMAPTAREMGLRIDEWMDERRDPVRSTQAAVAHLAYLNGQLGSWPLAAAAYNGGLGRIRRAMETARSDDLLQLIEGNFLPRETATYVPKILAAAVIGRDPARYGFYGLRYDAPVVYDTVSVRPLTRLAAVASAISVSDSADALKALNPHLVRGVVPPGSGMAVRVPLGLGSMALSGLERIPATERFYPVEDTREADHVVRQGDNWGRIAEGYEMRLEDLRSLNPDIGDRIYPGMSVKVREPVLVYGDEVVRPDGRVRAAVLRADSVERAKALAMTSAGVGRVLENPEYRSVEPVARKGSSNGPEKHRVVAGETMSGLATRYGVTVAQLVQWNGLKAPRNLYIGESLIVRPMLVEHTIAKGENLTSIAARYGVRVKDLVEWNKITDENILPVGRRLLVSAPVR